MAKLSENLFKIHTFEPVYNEHSKVLILGTMASPASVAAGFYYGHPQNRFWRLMSDLSGGTELVSREEKISFLLKNKIALWDVLRSCEICGASDSSIKNEEPADLLSVTSKAKIKAVFTTGITAFRLYNKHCRDIIGIEAVCLPSPSPANQRITYDEMLKRYSIIFQFNY